MLKRFSRCFLVEAAMLYLHINERFLERQSKRVNVFPEINGVSLMDYVNHNWPAPYINGWYLSALEKDPYAGLCEVVYGVKRWNDRYEDQHVKIQKLMVVPFQNTVPLIRNCYWRWGGMQNGFHSYGYTGKGVRGRYVKLDYLSGFDWIEENFPLEKVRWDGSLVTAEAIASFCPELKYCAYDCDVGMSAVDYIRLYKAHPTACEMLMKKELYRFVNEKAIEQLESNKSFAFWVSRNAESISSYYMAPRTAFNAWKKNPDGDPADYAKSLSFRIESGREASFSNKRVYHKALKYTTQEKIAAYIRKVKTDKHSYGDYLIACDWLRLDFSDTKVLFPHDFQAAHDNYTGQYGTWKREQYKKKEKAEAEKLRGGMVATASKFSFLSDFSDFGYCVLLAHSKDDLIDEGAALHHCVGRMDYDQRQAKGRSIICMIRKSDCPGIPFVTAEVTITDSQLRIAQCFGAHDKIVPEVKPFTDAWMSFCNKAYKERRLANA